VIAPVRIEAAKPARDDISPRRCDEYARNQSAEEHDLFHNALSELSADKRHMSKFLRVCSLSPQDNVLIDLNQSLPPV
jgi:hypothetical protein